MHLRPRSIALVAGGGALGTASRSLVSQVVPHVREVPVGVVLINVVGAFLLGLLLERLLRVGPDTGARLDLRLLLGTGFLGGFTTYSTLATSTAVLFLAGRGLAGTGYALLTVLAGAIATGSGLAIAGLVRPNGATS